jgi:thymidylate synthase (FAD)
METKKAKVTLFSFTEKPLECIALGIDIWSKFPVVKNWTEEELEEKFRWLLKQPHQTPFEYVNLVFIIENVSRAFQQQLTRHRVGFSYSIQSLRCADMGSFADNRAYTMPSTVKFPEKYHGTMLDIQTEYAGAVNAGESLEDARGILPLNIHSPITFACTYRSLIGMLKQRLCVAAQEEWVSVAEQIRQCLMKVDPLLTLPLDCMCKRFENGGGMCRTLNKKV